MQLLNKIFRFSQYTSSNHSLLSSIYSYTYNGHYLGYILLEHQTKSLISIDPGIFEPAFYNIKLLEQQHKYQLRYILQTHSSIHTKSTQMLFNKFSDVEVYAGEIDKVPTMHVNKIAKDLQPFTIGDLSICYFKEAGHQYDNYMIVVTHVTPTSTKIPIIFSGDSILINSVGPLDNYQEYFMTLQKLRGFHDETLIFPGHNVQKENLLFAKTLDPENIVINQKLDMDNLVPTTLIEERMGNPYFRFSHLKLDSDPIKYLKKLKQIQEKYFKK